MLWKVFALFLISYLFFNICCTYMFQIMKQIFILDKGKLIKYNILFLNDDFLY